MPVSMITVIGNVFVDVKGTAFGEVRKDAKNVGAVEISLGGVARNVATNLAALGSRSRLVSSCTTGGLGDEVMAQLRKAGVDSSYIRSYPVGGMGVWLAVLQQNGDLVASISEQPNPAYQEEAMLASMAAYVADSNLVAVDVCVSRVVNAQLVAMCHQHHVPVYGMVGNIAGLLSHVETMDGLDGLVCNTEEAEAITGMTIVDDADISCALQKLHELTRGMVAITLGEKGCAAISKDGEETLRVPAKRVAQVDSSGAGDAFFAGLLHGIATGNRFHDTLQLAVDTAAKVVSSKETTLPSATSDDD